MVGGETICLKGFRKLHYNLVYTTIAILVRASSALKSFNLDMMAFGERCSLTKIIAVTVIAQHRKPLANCFV